MYVGRMRTSTGRKRPQSKFNPASQIRNEVKSVGVEGRREWRGVEEVAEVEMTPKASWEPRVLECRLQALPSG